MCEKIYPRTGHKETVYLKHVVIGPNTEIGDGAVVTDDAAIEKPEALRWWEWDEDKIQRNIAVIQSGDVDALWKAK